MQPPFNQQVSDLDLSVYSIEQMVEMVRARNEQWAAQRNRQAKARFWRDWERAEKNHLGGGVDREHDPPALVAKAVPDGVRYGLTFGPERVVTDVPLHTWEKDPDPGLEPEFGAAIYPGNPETPYHVPSKVRLPEGFRAEHEGRAYVLTHMGFMNRARYWIPEGN
jgi:hypothetical protein